MTDKNLLQSKALNILNKSKAKKIEKLETKKHSSEESYLERCARVDPVLMEQAWQEGAAVAGITLPKWDYKDLAHLQKIAIKLKRNKINQKHKDFPYCFFRIMAANWERFSYKAHWHAQTILDGVEVDLNTPNLADIRYAYLGFTHYFTDIFYLWKFRHDKTHKARYYATSDEIQRKAKLKRQAELEEFEAYTKDCSEFKHWLYDNAEAKFEKLQLKIRAACQQQALESPNFTEQEKEVVKKLFKFEADFYEKNNYKPTIPFYKFVRAEYEFDKLKNPKLKPCNYLIMFDPDFADWELEPHMVYNAKTQEFDYET
jgi:hypothetical protein